MLTIFVFAKMRTQPCAKFTSAYRFNKIVDRTGIKGVNDFILVRRCAKNENGNAQATATEPDTEVAHAALVRMRINDNGIKSLGLRLRHCLEVAIRLSNLKCLVTLKLSRELLTLKGLRSDEQNTRDVHIVDGDCCETGTTTARQSVFDNVKSTSNPSVLRSLVENNGPCVHQKA